MDVQAQDIYNTTPVTHNGEKWRIGYLEGGPYANYQSILRQMIKNLMDSGWIEPESIPESRDESETKTLWDFLSGKSQSHFLEFAPENYWSCKWENKLREKLKPVIINRLKTHNGIDLMLAFGTWAGQDLVNDRHHTATMVLSASNAVQSGIMKRVDDSGYDHVHVWIDPEKNERQIRLFHDITGFKRLGIAYENDSDGRSYAGMDTVLKLSRELDFQIIECRVPIDIGIDLKEEKLIHCYEQLAPTIDSMYITEHAKLTKNSIPKLLSPLFKYKIPMFAQTRYDLVEYGIMMGVDRSNFKPDADFYVQTFASILNGAKPRDLPQTFESPLDIVINLESARKIGFRFPIDILASAFEVHETIELPDK